jgi:hypothetical protein
MPISHHPTVTDWSITVTVRKNEGSPMMEYRFGNPHRFIPASAALWRMAELQGLSRAFP